MSFLGIYEAAEHAVLVRCPRARARLLNSDWQREDQRSRSGGSDGLTTCPWSKSKAIFSALSIRWNVGLRSGLLLPLSEKVTSQTCFACLIRTAPQLLRNVLLNYDVRRNSFRLY